MAMMALWAAAVLMTCGVSVGIAQITADLRLNDPVPLDLAPNAVDDMYSGCLNDMKKRVKEEYLANENNKDTKLKRAWDKAGNKYNKKRKYKKTTCPSRSLETEEAMAIYVYTLDNPNIYLDFNAAVRTQNSEYKTTFRYHSLHFFLTSALQTLNTRKPAKERCLTGYRRVNRYFNQDVINKEVRLGSFTSSSMGQYPRTERFGDKSCFEIFTCFGADISLYSKLGDSEAEVLIPPYEVFKVTKIDLRSEKKELPCEVVYRLKSTRSLSNLNCALF